VNTRFPSCSEPTVLKMANDRWAMYDEFSDKGAHSTEWFEIVKNFLKLGLEDMCSSGGCIVNKGN
jgi:hypothetical protein